VPVPANNKVTDISNMFDCCHAFYTDDDENKVKIYLKFISNNNEGFSNLTALKKCTCTWQDCYLNKLTETWFSNTGNMLTNCNQAFKFAQFNQRYSDDVSDKIAYNVSEGIMVGN
jgi:hypothetical protein